MFEGVIDTLKGIYGEAIVYKGSGLLNHSFVGVFDENYVEVDPATGQAVSTQAITIFYKVSDLPETPANRSEFEVRGTTYFTRHVEVDGKGGARVFLMEE